jgi:hypothetical protein
MFNPILSEMVAREQHNDLIKWAEQQRLAGAASERRPTGRFNLRASIGNLLLPMRHLFRSLAHAE